MQRYISVLRYSSQQPDYPRRIPSDFRPSLCSQPFDLQSPKPVASNQQINTSPIATSVDVRFRSYKLSPSLEILTVLV
ncbi:hypothetical protein KC19_8G143800 [Ceratodon purpureus]|uniref:Uncharacterized protein n=1 Tax=Ceratodon purpureus TaxID=3225 RepID=A0A8T0H3B8_CERPU|nr:hypothetical protein KC19_8G143800 [Ceratodon purpureus]